jgi:hypothetical protein
MKALMARFEPGSDGGTGSTLGRRVVPEADALPAVVALESGTGARS